MRKGFRIEDFSRALAVTFLILIFTNCTVLKELRVLSDIRQENYEPVSPGSEARLWHIGAYPVIHLYGSTEEMGHQYGAILKPQIKSLFSILTSVFHKKELDEYLQLAKDVEPNLPEAIRTELKAVSEACGVDYSLLVAMNVATKVDCSTLAAWGKSTIDGQLIMGRNADYKTKGLNKYLGVIVVRHPENGIATVNITYLGLIGGFSGINEKGVCYGNMLSYNGKEESVNTEGMPIQLLLRMAAETAESADEYNKFLSGYKVMIPNIVMSADTEKAMVTELTQDGNDFREGYKGVLASSNYFHSGKLVKSYVPDERYSIILNEARVNYGSITVGIVKDIMYKARRKGNNVQCVIFEPSKMLVHASINKSPASAGPFTVIDARSLCLEKMVSIETGGD